MDDQPSKKEISAAASAMGKKGAKKRWAEATPADRAAQAERLREAKASISKKKLAKMLSEAGKKGAATTNAKKKKKLG